jgi:hypothetical protein
MQTNFEKQNEIAYWSRSIEGSYEVEVKILILVVIEAGKPVLSAIKLLKFLFIFQESEIRSYIRLVF